MESAQPINAALLVEKEKYLRYEKVSELFTYLGVISAFFLTTLRYDFQVDRKALYLLFAFILVFSFAWFRLLPKKYTGFAKTAIYYFCATIFVWVGIHFTNGIQSFALFFYYLTVLGSAASLTTRYYLTVIGFIIMTLLIEAFLFSPLDFSAAASLVSVQIWAVVVVASFGKMVFDEEKTALATGISERLKLAKQIDAVKNEFVFVISNKLRQPILTLQNFLDSALKAKDKNWSADFTDLLNKTRENSQRLSRLVNDLSDLSRIESQKLSLDIQPINLNSLVGSTLSDFSMSASEKKVELKYEPSPQDIIVRADPSRLHEILANLIDNAIKYSPLPSKVNISFATENGMALIKISDQGYGIPEEAKSHLFEKFYRVNRSATEAKGTGLGLFVTKELVERQGGKIWFESEVGKGTTFYFTLLLEKENAENN